MMQFRYPVNFIGITQGFKSNHQALDLGWNSNYGGKNQPIYAAYDGTVDSVVDGKNNNQNNSSDAGNLVRIKHEGGFITRYIHLKKGSISVKPGDIVKTGQQIANMGNTGYSFGEHLHYDVWLNNKKVNPLLYTYVYPGQKVASSTQKAYGNQLLIYSEPTPVPEPGRSFKVGDNVKPNKTGQLYDYNGKKIVAYDKSYKIIELVGDRAVLAARGQIWAAMNIDSIEKI